MKPEEAHENLNTLQYVNAILKIMDQDFFSFFPVRCVLSNWICCGVLKDIHACLGWTESESSGVCAAGWLPISEDQTLKCQQFLCL